jgi:TRAP transporter TAXI family solute receptor
MFRKSLSISAIILLALLLVVPQAYAKTRFIRMVSGPEGGSWYPLGVGMMQLVEKGVPNVSTSNGPGGGVGNCKAIQRGQADLGWSYTHTTYNAYNGRGKFTKKHDKLRHLMSLYPGVFQMVVPKKSDITDISQLGDKRIVPGKVGFTGTAIAEIVLKAYGITFDSIKKNGGTVSYVGYTDSAALMKDGHSDCYMAVTSCPQATIIDLNFQPGVRFLGIDDAHVKKVRELEAGLMPTMIPKTAYKGLPADVQTVGTVTNIIVSADLPDDLVYQIVKTIYAGFPELAKIKKKAISESKPENALLGASIPVHPGAMRYYKEKGISPK